MPISTSRAAPKRWVAFDRSPGDKRQQLARPRSHGADHRLFCGNVGDNDPFILQMATQPGQIALQRGAGHDNKECRFGQAVDGQVAFHTAASVQHLGIVRSSGGQTVLSVKDLAAIAAYFDISLNFFFGTRIRTLGNRV